MCDKGHFKIIAHILTNGAMEEILSGKVHFIFITSHLVGQSFFLTFSLKETPVKERKHWSSGGSGVLH